MKSFASFPRVPALLLGFSMMWTGCTDNQQAVNELLEKAENFCIDAASREGDERAALLDKAVETLEHAAELDPNRIEPKLALADIKWRKGDEFTALKLSESLKNEHPEDYRVWVLWGDYQYNIFKWKSAIAAYEKAMDLGGDKKVLILRLGGAFGKDGDFERAFETYDQAADLGVPQHIVDLNLGFCYEGTMNPDLALQYYLKSHQENPSYIPTLIKLTEFYLEKATPDSPELTKARAYAEKAYELKPSDIKVQSNLADIYNILKDYESALRIVDQALKDQPDDPQLLKYKSGLEKQIESKKEE